MQKWHTRDAEKIIYRFGDLSEQDQTALLTFLDNNFPPETVNEQIQRQRKALENLSTNRTVLSRAIQLYPESIASNQVPGSVNDLDGYAVVLTAGGEGERLRLSLEKEGVAPERLVNFTKATFPLPDFYQNFGTLQTTLSLLSKISRDTGIDIPVIVTTGPLLSKTAQIIPAVLNENDSFGLKNVRVINQDERLHLTGKEQIVHTVVNNQVRPVTNPDETGGPIMKLKKNIASSSQSMLDWCRELGCTKLILLQATALYELDLLITIASAGKKYDGLGVGIARESFPENDPYGTFILLEQEGQKRLIIAEPEVRNTATRTLRDNDNANFLPFNTGLYSIDIEILESNDLPDYATPPKEILPDLPRSPKIGYAATDIISFAGNPAVLTVARDSFGVIKNNRDLIRLSQLGKKSGLDKICKELHGH